MGSPVNAGAQRGRVRGENPSVITTIIWRQQQ